MKRIKMPAVAVPKDLADASKFIANMAREQRAIDLVQSRLNEQVDVLKERAIADSQPHEKAKGDLLEGLYIFASANRQKLTDDGKKKTVELPGGSFSWRLTPPAVALKDIKQVIADIKSLGLDRFLRVKEEVDKEAMLKEQDVATTIKGVSIKQREDFIVRPSELEVEIFRSAK